jgi:hypothetical protein
VAGCFVAGRFVEGRFVGVPNIYHAEKTLQLLDVLSGGGQVLIVSVCLAVGAKPATEIV